MVGIHLRQYRVAGGISAHVLLLLCGHVDFVAVVPGEDRGIDRMRAQLLDQLRIGGVESPLAELEPALVAAIPRQCNLRHDLHAAGAGFFQVVRRDVESVLEGLIGEVAREVRPAHATHAQREERLAIAEDEPSLPDDVLAIGRGRVTMECLALLRDGFCIRRLEPGDQLVGATGDLATVEGCEEPVGGNLVEDLLLKRPCMAFPFDRDLQGVPDQFLRRTPESNVCHHRLVPLALEDPPAIVGLL